MKKYRIEEVCKVKSSKRIYASDYSESGVPFFRGKEITELSQNKEISDVLFITEERFRDIDEKFGSPRIGDILMTAVGTLGNVWMVDILPIYFKDGNLIWFSDFKTELISPNYLKLLFESRRFQDLLLKKGTIGSVQSALTIEKVKKLSLTLPSLELQNNIVEEISRITNLSLLNYKIIRELEEYSQLLFHKWFVDFNFPNENGEPYKNSGGKMITLTKPEYPKSWSKSLFGELTSIRTGKRDANFSTEDGQFPFFTCSKDQIKSPSYSFDCKAMILAGNGEFWLNRYDGKFEAYQRNYVIEVKSKIMFDYLYLYLQKHLNQITKQSAGSIIKYLKIGMITDFEVILPNDEVLKKFNEIIGPLLLKIDMIKAENGYLTEYRDLLINKLIK